MKWNNFPVFSITLTLAFVLAGLMASSLFAQKTSFDVHVRDAALSVSATDAEIGQLMETISEKAGFPITVSPDVWNRTLSITFTDVGIEQGIRKLLTLADLKSFIMQYAEDGSISKLFVFSEGSAVAVATPQLVRHNPAVQGQASASPTRSGMSRITPARRPDASGNNERSTLSSNIPSSSAEYLRQRSGSHVRSGISRIVPARRPAVASSANTGSSPAPASSGWSSAHQAEPLQDTPATENHGAGGNAPAFEQGDNNSQEPPPFANDVAPGEEPPPFMNDATPGEPPPFMPQGIQGEPPPFMPEGSEDEEPPPFMPKG